MNGTYLHQVLASQMCPFIQLHVLHHKNTTISSVFLTSPILLQNLCLKFGNVTSRWMANTGKKGLHFTTLKTKKSQHRKYEEKNPQPNNRKKKKKLTNTIMNLCTSPSSATLKLSRYWIMNFSQLMKQHVKCEYTGLNNGTKNCHKKSHIKK